jgi:hypothetical protein
MATPAPPRPRRAPRLHSLLAASRHLFTSTGFGLKTSRELFPHHQQLVRINSYLSTSATTVAAPSPTTTASSTSLPRQQKLSHLFKWLFHFPWLVLLIMQDNMPTTHPCMLLGGFSRELDSVDNSWAISIKSPRAYFVNSRAIPRKQLLKSAPRNNLKSTSKVAF